MSARWLVVLLAGACGRVGFDGDTTALPDGGAHDGTRLRIVWNTFDDGTRTPAGIYDSERGEACEVRTWADGQLYCTPTERERAWFSDAACSVALVMTATCRQEPYAYTDDRCSGVLAHLYHQAAPSLATQSYALDTNGGCALQPGSGLLFETTEVAPAELARVEITGATVRAYVADDGFALPFALRDRTLGVECGPVEGTGAYSCLPLAHTDATYGLDPTCTTRTVAAPPSCPAPAFAGYVGADCRAHVAAVTSTVSPIGGWSLPLCADAENGPNAAWYQLGPDVDGPALARTVDPLATGRRFATITIGAGLRDTVLFDSVLGLECAPGLTADGVSRCLPLHRARTAQLADNATDCLVMATEHAIVSLGCADPAPDIVLRGAPGGVCGNARYDVLGVGAPVTGYGLVGGACAALPAYQVGAPIDPTIYAAFTTGIDP